MKKIVVTVSFFLIVFLALNAQNPSQRPINIKGDTISEGVRNNLPDNTRKIDTAEVQVPNIYAWKITPRLGERIFVPRDTAVFDFHQTMLVDGKSVAMGYLGNVGSPAQSKIFFDRPEASRFTFSDAMYLWRKGPGDHYFLNTKIPYSNIKYQSGGGGERAENRFQGEITMNMGKKLNVGFDFDYVYSRGFYNSLSNKQVIYDLYASYIGDKYKMHAYIHNNNFKNIENGGIADTTYITNPNSENIRGFSGKSRDIPVRMENTWNHMRGRHIYLTNRYDLGNDMEEYPVNDSTMGYRKKKDYVPLASAILTTHYNDQRRRFKSTDSNLDNLYVIEGKGFPYNGDYSANPLYTDNINDYMSYYSFKNTLALAMNEGFRKWTKFGLTAFAEFDLRKYSFPAISYDIDTNNPAARPNVQTHKAENSFTIGGVLSKEKGRYLRYRASGEYDLLQNDFKLEGEVTTMLKIAGKDFSVKANAYIKNTTPSFFDRHFVSKYWSWNNDPTKAEQDANPNLKKFGHIRRVYAGGEINFPKLSFSETKISGGVETLNDYVYYNALGLPEQHTDSKGVQVISLRLDQKLHHGILHWDNQIVYQSTTNSDVIPLPTLSFYSNLYITSKIAKVLTFQLGVDAHFHTRYYMPGYQPLTMQFYNQKDMELGNFPVATAYANLHLKYTRFFIMMYNVAEGMFNSESFSLYRYPVNSRALKLGISWQFNN